ncbi:uncharacterized protein LY79DRAFT_536263 [Colletotrichum navitas]|uniref:Uncharacterized protein n=1 Tax=Colletotrichum navitas TaxID=681940 RepID=A0AAD8V933_9PEZI|nr:uncharacterized protein LY79DRAFT_536263 [Colletotrichum navitas]KAK1598862.1 hypothetical protein LY79DRAFT_536263 [Colletotrichum navitas]
MVPKQWDTVFVALQSPLLANYLSRSNAQTRCPRRDKNINGTEMEMDRAADGHARQLSLRPFRHNLAHIIDVTRYVIRTIQLNKAARAIDNRPIEVGFPARNQSAVEIEMSRRASSEICHVHTMPILANVMAASRHPRRPSCLGGQHVTHAPIEV